MMWRHLWLIGWFGCVMLISGSPRVMAVEPSLSTQPALNEKELFPYKSKGHAAAAGQVFLSSLSGKAFTQAGVSIYLIPTVSYTRYWFDRNVRVNICSAKHDNSPSENATAVGSPSTDCLHHILAQLLTDKRLLPYLRTTRANPTGHFWFTKIPAGRYYIVSLLEGGNGPHKEEHSAGIAWLTIELDADEKATNLVLTDCKSSLC